MIKDPLRRLLMGGEMRRLRKGCEKKLADLPISHPFSIEGLVANMEDARGRSICLMPVDDPGADLRTACGLRIKGRTTSYVLYRRRPTPNQTEHTILHELAHEWLDHGTPMPTEEVARYVTREVLDLVRQLGPEAIVQARGHYATFEEREAELSASLIKRMALQDFTPGEDLVSALESSLSHPVAPPRLPKKHH
ncbi:hypothetical protein [Streptomyces decoyicus]|uniref:hypothetical protein n=1 Tax=Streptomyces decoyicus TaxID=249567 RepID=UPI003666A55A